MRAGYAEETELGRRRTSLIEAAPAREIALEAFIEREPVTVILSKRGWIKAMKGHADLSAKADYKFKEGDAQAQVFHAQTTDKILVATANGRFYTIGADKLPGARGFGEPLGTMIDIEAGNDIIDAASRDARRTNAAGGIDRQGLPLQDGGCCCRNAQGQGRSDAETRRAVASGAFGTARCRR